MASEIEEIIDYLTDVLAAHVYDGYDNCRDEYLSLLDASETILVVLRQLKSPLLDIIVKTIDNHEARSEEF